MIYVEQLDLGRCRKCLVSIIAVEGDVSAEVSFYNNGKNTYNIVICKLTPKEYWRLMGFNDSDFEKAKSAGISNTQLYKQAGNSIVVDVLQYIFRNLFGKGVK